MKTASPPKATALKRAARKPAVVKAKPTATGRISVRLKPALAEKLAEAQREQGHSVTEIIEAALEKHLSATMLRKPRMTLLEAFEKHGLLGTVDMPPDASRNYKKYISEYLDEKYPQHGHR